MCSPSGSTTGGKHYVYTLANPSLLPRSHPSPYSSLDLKAYRSCGQAGSGSVQPSCSRHTLLPLPGTRTRSHAPPHSHTHPAGYTHTPRPSASTHVVHVIHQPVASLAPHQPGPFTLHFAQLSQDRNVTQPLVLGITDQLTAVVEDEVLERQPLTR